MTDDPIRNPQRLAALRRLSLLDTPAEPAFDRLTRLASKILKVPVSMVSLIDADRQFMKSAVGLPEPLASRRELPLSLSICKHTLGTHQPLIIENAPEHPLTFDNLMVSDFGAMAYAGIPLIIPPQGYVIGSFCVIDIVPRVWTEDEIAILQDLAASIMTEIALRSELIERKQAQEAMKEAEAALRSAYDREKELRELRSQFMSMLSHDFRIPLTVIRSSADILKQYGSRLTDEQRSNHLETIQSQITRQLDLLNDMLMLNQAESVGLDFNPMQSDLERFCRILIDEFQVAVGTTHQLRFMTTGANVNAWVDQKLLHRAISNLLSNAVKYSPQGGTIRLNLTTEDDQVVISIHDEGIGIPEADIQRLFEPFFRAANTRSIPGTGLGMVIVKQMIEAHGGTITVKSEVGVGTTFVITLPKTRPVDTREPSQKLTIS